MPSREPEPPAWFALSLDAAYSWSPAQMPSLPAVPERNPGLLDWFRSCA